MAVSLMTWTTILRPGTFRHTSLMHIKRQRAPGIKRIQSELLKVAIKASKQTIQRDIRHVRPPRPHEQTWATFLRNYAKDIWACDFLQVTDLFSSRSLPSSSPSLARGGSCT
jgi:hypothetical protein